MDETSLNKNLKKSQRKNNNNEKSNKVHQQINLRACPHHPPPIHQKASFTQGVVAAALLMTVGVCIDHIVLLCQRRCFVPGLHLRFENQWED